MSKSVRVPNYRLKENVNVGVPMGENEVPTLPMGMFVKPIELRYVPKDTLASKRWAWFDKYNETFCYTTYGLIPIPDRFIEEDK